jgi:hypothetical protein
VIFFEGDKIPKSAIKSIDIVIHLAGFAHDMRNANKLKDLYPKVNEDATVELAMFSEKRGVKKFFLLAVLRWVEVLPLGDVQVKKTIVIQKEFMGKPIER